MPILSLHWFPPFLPMCASGWRSQLFLCGHVNFYVTPVTQCGQQATVFRGLACEVHVCFMEFQVHSVSLRTVGMSRGHLDFADSVFLLRGGCMCDVQ